ncbi:MAG: hypothetical protein M0T77_11030 [Actinomycetota bacterium]|nr:hypothetical protein [Actinomycetota bacterium]
MSACHLALGPIGQRPALTHHDLDPAWYHPATHPAACINEHLAQMIDLLNTNGHNIRLQLPAITA